jgi:MoaA/NifB/PqqE/SkfB family radical SAM enzyme
MQATKYALSAKAIIKNRLLGARQPLSVSYTVTNRCNKKCAYCKVWDTKEKELGTEEALGIIDELGEMGCQRLGLTGGEPLLRKDIGEIIGRAKEKGIFTGLVTNGSLVPKRIEELKELDLLQVSLDGPKEVHDKHRGKGAYKEAIKAIRIARENDMRVWVTTVLTA